MFDGTLFNEPMPDEGNAYNQGYADGRRETINAIRNYCQGNDGVCLGRFIWFQDMLRELGFDNE